MATIVAVSINHTILKHTATTISTKQATTNRIPDLTKTLERLIRRLIFIVTCNLFHIYTTLFLTKSKINARHQIRLLQKWQNAYKQLNYRSNSSTNLTAIYL